MIFSLDLHDLSHTCHIDDYYGCSYVFKIRAQKKAVAHQPQSINVNQSAGRDKHVQNQMFILMISSIGIFLVSTLPLTIDHVVSSYTITDLAGIEKLLITMPILNWIQTLNYAVSFFLINI
jgi:hypothetical protein